MNRSGPDSANVAGGGRQLSLRVRSTVVRCACLTVLAMLLLAAGFALSDWSLGELPWSVWLLGVGLTFGVFWGVRASALAPLRSGVFTALVIALVIVPRLAWVVAVPTLPVYDYERYHTAALAVLHGASHGTPLQDFGVVTFLAVLASVFGPGLMAGKLANVLLAVVTALLLLALGRRVFGEPAGRAAALLFALWPADISFRSVFATEFGFVPGWLAGSLVLLRAAGKQRGATLEFVLAGALFGLGSAFRPVGALLVPVALVWLAARTQGRRSRVFARGMALVGGFMVVLAAQLAVGRALGFDVQASTLGLNIMTGTDAAAEGQYSDETAELFHHWVERKGPGRALVTAVCTGWRRIASQPAAFLGLAFEKYGVMWGNDSYGVQWSTQELGKGPASVWAAARQEHLFVVSQFYYLGLLVFGALGSWRLVRRRFVRSAALLLLVLPAFALMHVVLEVQSRYHYPLAYVVLLLSGAGLISAGPRVAGLRAPDA
jgi:4-amino-4-deoxy-L-arabinose transferase-like glycosyltransferase